MKNVIKFALTLFAVIFSQTGLANVLTNGSVSVNHNDNIPNAAGSANIFSDTYAEANFSIGKLFTPAVGKNILLSAQTQARSHAHKNGLNRLVLGGALSYTQRLGLGAYAPRFNLSAEVMQHNFQEDLRDSWIYRAGLGIEKRFTPALRAEASFQYEDRNAHESNAIEYHHDWNKRVFFQQNLELNGSVEYTFENYSSLTLRYRYRDGEADTSIHPGSPLSQFSTAIAWDAAMGDDYVVYLLDSSSNTFAVEWSYPLTDDTALGFSYENRVANAVGNNTYRSNILSVQLTLRF